jgi:hypothetical protein
MGSLGVCIDLILRQHWEPQPPGTLRACPDLYRDCFAFYDSVTLLLGTYQNGYDVADISEVRASSMILGAFAKLRKRTIGFAISVRPHVRLSVPPSDRPRGTARLPLDGFS